VLPPPVGVTVTVLPLETEDGETFATFLFFEATAMVPLPPSTLNVPV